MKNSGPDRNKDTKQKLATGYSSPFLQKERLVFTGINTHALSPATGMYATLEDLCCLNGEMRRRTKAEERDEREEKTNGKAPNKTKLTFPKLAKSQT